MSGLGGTFRIYDNKNKLVCTANFVRIEYLDLNIAPAFMAVFKRSVKLPEGQFYCLGNVKGLKNINVTEFSDSIFTTNLMSEMKIARAPYVNLEQVAIHFRLNESDSILYILNSDTYSYIVLTNTGRSKVLYKSSDSETISNLIIVPYYQNNMPQLLTQCMMPEGDLTWENLLTFDGSKYDVSPSQRLD